MNSRGWIVRLMLAASIGMVVSSPALAHGDLKSSVPANKARITTPPASLRLVFTERPELPLTRVVLKGPGGQPITLGKLVASGGNMATVTAAVTGAMLPGEYTVEWETAGEDGHPVDGKFTFTLIGDTTRAPATTNPPVDSSTRPAADTQHAHHDTLSMPTSSDRFDAESGGFVAVRFAFYTALLVVIGAVAFRFVVLGLLSRDPAVDNVFADEAAARAAKAASIASVILLVGVLGRLVAQTIALNGPEAADSTRLAALVTTTTWGWSWIAQLIATVVAIVGFQYAKRSSRGTGWAIAGVAALALAFTPAFASHAAAVPGKSTIAMLSDGLHILGASGWLGSLVLVLIAGIPAAMSLDGDRRGTAVADLINAFSPTALAFAGLVAATGVFAAWLHLGSVAALWESSYGKLLLAKVAILSIVALTGAYNWLRVKPSLGTVAGVTRIRRSAAVEVGVGVLVLLVTAILVATPTPIDGM